MAENKDFFTPEDVDEIIAHLAELHQSNTENARLVHDLRRVLPYSQNTGEDVVSLQAVWQRITHEPLQIHTSSPKNARLLKVQTTEKRAQQTYIAEKRSIRSRLSIVAAVILLTLLVGSMAYVFHTFKDKSNNATGHAGISASGGQGTTLYTHHTDKYSDIGSLTWSRDGKRILSTNNNTVEMWDAITGNNRITYNFPSNRTPADVKDISWSPDNKYIAMANDAIYITNSQTQKITVKLTYRTQVAIIKEGAPSGLSVRSSNAIALTTPSRLFDNQMPASSGAPVFSRVIWSPDGKYIAASYQESLNNSYPILVWDVTSGNLITRYTKQNSDINALAWSPNGPYIASASIDATVHVWNAFSGEDIYIQNMHKNSPWANMQSSDGVSSITWSPDGRRIASADYTGVVTAWNALTGKNSVKVQIPYRNVSTLHTGISSLVWSPDGKQIAAGGYGVHILNATTLGTIFTYNENPTYISALAWSPDSNYIASGDIVPTSADPDAKDFGTVKVWRAR